MLVTKERKAMYQLDVPHFTSQAQYTKWANEQLAQGVVRRILYNDLSQQAVDDIPFGEFEARYGAFRELIRVTAERNIKGIELEKAGQIEDAVKLYEQNLADKDEGTHAYERLRIIYTRQGKLSEAIRVCEAFISQDNECATDYEKNKFKIFRKHLEKLNAKLQSDSENEQDPKARKKRPQNISPRVLPSEEQGIPICWIVGDKLSKFGSKALYKSRAGQAITIEQLALEHYTLTGCNGLWSENEYWWALMSLLFWDVIFAKLPGVYTPQFGAFPSPLQDMPLDFFKPEFYESRKYLIQKRIRGLSQHQLFSSSNPNLVNEIEALHKRHFGEPCRSMNWEKYRNVEPLLLALTSLSSLQIMNLMNRMIQNFNKYRKGLPDLFLVCNGKLMFVEVKAEDEKVVPHQYDWMHFLITTIGVHVEICRIRNP